jgi:hypothetical protein
MYEQSPNQRQLGVRFHNHFLDQQIRALGFQQEVDGDLRELPLHRFRELVLHGAK